MKGSKRERKPGVWELRVFTGRARGKAHQVSRTYRGAAKGADARLRKLIDEVERGKHHNRAKTFGDLLDAWMAVAERNYSPTTLRSYRSYIARHIAPALGHKALHRLSAADLDGLYLGLRLSPSAVRQHHYIIAKALDQGVRWEWVGENVARKATPPKLAQRVVEAPTPAEVRALLDACEDPETGRFLFLAVTTGARRGELLGLRWSDWRDQSLTIARSVVDVNGHALVKSTKSERGVRTIALDPASRAVLQAQRLSAHGDGYVFTRCVKGCCPWNPDMAARRFRRVREKAGVSFRFHDLRHFAVTYLLMGGFAARTVSGRVGHSPRMTLEVYGHAVQGADIAAGEYLARLVGADGAEDGRVLEAGSDLLAGGEDPAVRVLGDSTATDVALHEGGSFF